MDPHELLGLSTGADAAAIKRAFRRLAMRWHPDRNPAPDAAEHFKRLRAACDSLLAGLAGTPADDSVSEDTPPPARPRGADRRQDLALDLENLCAGGEFPLEIERRAPCSACEGRGRRPLAHSRLCADCHGSGKLRRGGKLHPCPVCEGRGYRRDEDCPACAGHGEAVQRTTLLVRVPAGLLPGDELRLEGQGGEAPGAEGTAGDLYVRIALRPHPLYRLHGRDVLLERPVSALRLLLGGELIVPGPRGRHTLTLESSPMAARTLRIPGAGLPGRRGEPDGDLLVSLQPLWPEDCRGPLRAPLEALESALQRDLPRYLAPLADWEARWLQP